MLIRTETKNCVEIIGNLYSYLISKPLITNLEAITVLRLGFPKDITEKIINTIKENTLCIKMYLLALELETKTLFNRYVIYYIDEDDMSEIFCYDPEGDYDRSYGEHYSYIDYDSDNISLDLDYSD